MPKRYFMRDVRALNFNKIPTPKAKDTKMTAKKTSVQTINERNRAFWARDADGASTKQPTPTVDTENRTGMTKIGSMTAAAKKLWAR